MSESTEIDRLRRQLWGNKYGNGYDGISNMRCRLRLKMGRGKRYRGPNGERLYRIETGKTDAPFSFSRIVAGNAPWAYSMTVEDVRVFVAKLFNSPAEWLAMNNRARPRAVA